MEELRDRVSVGWDGRDETFDVFLRYKEFIHDVYFAAPEVPSGRASDSTHSRDYQAKMEELLKGLESNGIRANMLFNGMCAGELTGSRQWAKQVFSILERYVGHGVTDVTCMSVTDMLLIKKYFAQVTVHASVNMFIDSIAKYAQVKNVADVITIDRNINYDLQKINLIRDFATDKKLKLLVNEGCLTDCIHRIQHFNALAHNKNMELSYCKHLFVKNPGLILDTPFVRPEDLHHYFGIIDYFKIASRCAMSSEHLELMLKAYTECEYNGNLFDLVSSDGIAAAIQAMGIQMFIDNPQVPPDFFESRTRYRDECITYEPINITDVFGNPGDE
ncbi:MAG: hypothetical protein HY663_06325 [Chloroflexi bacterium]|nr:hypothetical protein [Chloroflexota bacterium]